MMGTYYWYIGCSLPKLSPEQPALAVEVKLLAFITDPEELYVTYIYIRLLARNTQVSAWIQVNKVIWYVLNMKRGLLLVSSTFDFWTFLCAFTPKLVSLKADRSGFPAGSFFLWSSGETCDYSTVQVEANITHLISWTDITLVYLGTFNHQNSFTQANWSFCIAPLPIGRK